MSLLPIEAFPINNSPTSSNSFAFAVIVGLIFFIASQKKVIKNESSTF